MALWLQVCYGKGFGACDLLMCIDTIQVLADMNLFYQAVGG